MLTKLQSFQTLELFSNRAVFAAPGEAPQPQAVKPDVKTEFIDQTDEQLLPEQADVNKPLGAETLTNIIDKIDQNLGEKRKAIAEYAKQPGADTTWALAKNQELIENAGAAKQHFREKWARYGQDLEAKRQGAVKTVVDDLQKTADANLQAKERQVRDTGANYAEFKEKNPEWLKQHEGEIMTSVAALGENLYQSGELRKINQYDAEVGDDRLSNYQEGRYFGDVVGDTDVVDEETNTEQYTQGIATAVLAMYGPEAEQKFKEACKDQEKEEVGFFDDAGFYSADARQAALTVPELQGADQEKAKTVMAELKLPTIKQEGYAHQKETLGFVYTSLLVAQKELDGDMYEKYVQYLKTKINDRPKDNYGNLAGFDYRQIMNPLTFKNAYLQSVANLKSNDSSLEGGNLTEKNQKFLDEAKGKIEAARTLWQNGSAAIEGMSNANLQPLREINDLEAIVKSIEGNATILANVDLGTQASTAELGNKAAGLEAVVLAQLEPKFNEKREAAKKQIQDTPAFKVLGEMADGKNPTLLKSIQEDPGKNYILQNILAGWNELTTAKFTAKTPAEIQALMAKITAAAKNVNEAVAVLAPVLVKPAFEPEKAKAYAASKRGVELRDVMDALGITEKNAKYYSAFKSLEEGDGNVRILVQDKDGWHPVKFKKEGGSIFKQMKEMGLNGSKVAIDTTGIDKAVATYGGNWQDMQKKYRSEYAGAFHVSRPRVAVAKKDDGKGSGDEKPYHDGEDGLDPSGTRRRAHAEGGADARPLADVGPDKEAPAPDDKTDESSSGDGKPDRTEIPTA